MNETTAPRAKITSDPETWRSVEGDIYARDARIVVDTRAAADAEERLWGSTAHVDAAAFAYDQIITGRHSGRLERREDIA